MELLQVSTFISAFFSSLVDSLLFSLAIVFIVLPLIIYSYMYLLDRYDSKKTDLNFFSYCRQKTTQLLNKFFLLFEQNDSQLIADNQQLIIIEPWLGKFGPFAYYLLFLPLLNILFLLLVQKLKSHAYYCQLYFGYDPNFIFSWLFVVLIASFFIAGLFFLLRWIHALRLPNGTLYPSNQSNQSKRKPIFFRKIIKPLDDKTINKQRNMTLLCIAIGVFLAMTILNDSDLKGTDLDTLTKQANDYPASCLTEKQKTD